MHILTYLSDPNCESHPKASAAEYRLLCSGTVHQDVNGDPYKSEGARILLGSPLRLFVVSRPLYDYPCELSLQISVPLVKESVAIGEYTSHPDDEVAKDLAALLTLLFRRLVTVCGNVSRQYSDYSHPLFRDGFVPMPLATRMVRVHWPRHPGVLATSLQGQEYLDYNPRDKPLDGRWLTELLTALPRISHAETVVVASRLYALAMELLHDRPDMAYQTLISCVETLANNVFEDFEPDDGAKIKHKKPVFDAALTYGMNETDAKRLAIVACAGEYWATKKFKRFLVDNVADSVWTEPDELFHRIPISILPKRENFERILGDIYRARSKATHVGQRFPSSASYTGGPSIDTLTASALYGSEPAFPPVVWFERIVNSALFDFWQREVTDLSAVEPPD